MENNGIEKRKLTLDDLAHEEDGVEFWYAREMEVTGSNIRQRGGATWA